MAGESNRLRFLSVAFLIITSIIHAASKSTKDDISFARSLQLDNKLHELNKRPIKTIESPDGDTIDCISMFEQLAFDHPLLKNHKIQMKPSVYPKGTHASKSESKEITQLWKLNATCPVGTVPIRRIKIDDLLRAESIERFGMKKKSAIHISKSAEVDNVQNGHEHAIAYVAEEGAKYYGAKATLNVWNPIVEDKEFSLAQIWVIGGPIDDVDDTIEAGWQVYPQIYGDKNTRLFIYWTSDGYRSKGCYNLGCPGFIQVDRSIVLGSTLSPISTYADHQYEITLSIFKDKETGNWWLQFGNEVMIGYWPASLFTSLGDSASSIEWGGEIVNTKKDNQHTMTRMGSGHFSSEGFSKASFFKHMKYVDDANLLKDPKGLDLYMAASNCYDVQKFDEGRDEYHIYFGGPGRNIKCP